MNKIYIEKLVFEAIGEVSAVFMSNPQKGTTQIMPSEELKIIGERLVKDILEVT